MCVGCLGKRWPGFERLLIKRLEQNMFYQGLPLVCVCVCVCDNYRTVHCDLIFKGQNIMLLVFLTLKIGQLHCPETLGTDFPMSLHHIPHEQIPHQPCCADQKNYL